MKATGTIRENRTKHCPVMPSKIMEKTTERGFIDYRFDSNNQILITKWHDNTSVTVATNYSQAFPTGSATRYSQKLKKEIVVAIPKVIAEYNKSMGGVDLLDKQVSLYRVRIRGKKWWFPLFTQLLDIAVVNTWRIHQHVNPNDKLSLLEARRKIVLAYVSKQSAVPRQRPGPQRRLLGGRVSEDIRFDHGNHFVTPIPTQRRCAFCGKKTKRICDRCNVPLHDLCFAIFHTK